MTARLAAIVLIASLSTAVGADEPKPVPEKFRVKFETSAGDFVIEVIRKWAPIGADHFFHNVDRGFYDECRFFRVVPGFVVQFGIAGDPAVQKEFGEKNLQDEDVVASNMRGFVTYAKSAAPNSRTTQLFINLGDNARLDQDGFSPFGRVVEGMDIVDRINAEYGGKPSNRQTLIERHGNKYLNRRFPNLDYVKKAIIVKDDAAENPESVAPAETTDAE